MTALPQTAKFYEAVRQELTGTPYVLTPTPQGFDLALDLVNAKWLATFNKAGLRSSYVHHVGVAPNGTYRILDDKITFQWRAGVPTGFRYERVQGRLTEVGFKKSWGIRESGEFARSRTTRSTPRKDADSSGEPPTRWGSRRKCRLPW